MRKAMMVAVFVAAASMACTDGQVVSQNLSRAAENFEIMRRVVFLNGITDTYLLSIEGLCMIEDEGRQLEVTCMVGDREYKKHFLGLSDNVTYFAEQLDSAQVSAYHYRVTFKPQTILPDVDFRGSGRELLENSSEQPR
jgi:hypothetical protein